MRPVLGRLVKLDTRRGRRPTRSTEPIEGLNHGTQYAYRKGCGCGPCRLANRVACCGYKPKDTSSTTKPLGRWSRVHQDVETPTRYRCITCGRLNITTASCGHPQPWHEALV